MEGLGQSVEQIKQEKTHLSYTFIQKIAIHTLECLEFMHKVNYIHRDLKPQNILISTRGRLTNRICLIDINLNLSQ
jgi:serine/threonine protein kinase